MKCICCQSNDWLYLFQAQDRMLGVKGKFSEYRCRSCGLIRLDPQPTKQELKKYYPSTAYYSYSANAKKSFFGMLRSYLIAHSYKPTLFSQLIELVVRVPAMPTVRPGRILDVGCGSGDTLALLSEVGWQAYGMDMDKNAIRAANARGLKNVSYGTDVDIKKYPNNFFDAIRLYHVVEHLDDPRNFFQLAYKKLKPGGELILGTPNGDSLVARIARQYWYNLDAPRHLFIFSPHTLRLLARKANFKKSTIEFASAGGWIGSLQYVINERMGTSWDLINRAWLVMLVYPWEWIIDRIALGDVFVLRVKKS